MPAKRSEIEIEGVKWRLTSKWQNVWGNWQFWWQQFDSDADEWVNDSNGDLDWANRMSNHYGVKITGEYPESKSKDER